MPIDNVRVSKSGRDKLIRLKAKTGIQNWNTLCRWAFCMSLAEESIPPDANIKLDSPIEMTWRTFGGTYHEIYDALLRERCLRDGFELTDEVLELQFKLHLHRGIGYFFGDREITDISGLMSVVVG